MQAKTVVEPKTPGWPDLRELALLEGKCVSVYLAGHKAGAGSRPMRVRLRAMLSQAEPLLEGRDVLLDPLRARAEDPELGAGHGDGMAMFRTSRAHEEFRLPWSVEDMVAVEDRPWLTPLARGLGGHPAFLLLALSQRNTRLLECGPGSERELALPAGVPQAMEEYGGFERPSHVRGRTGGGVKFGLDTFREKQPRHLHDFCRAIERGLRPLLDKRGLPLVLAGAPSELSAYRAVNRYEMLAPEAVEGSPDGGWTDAGLADKGRTAMRDWSPAGARHAAEMFVRTGPERRSAEVHEILRAAAAGRVWHLSVAGSPDQRWGDERWINAAAVETWRHDGNVWMVDEPVDGTPVAAVFRW